MRIALGGGSLLFICGTEAAVWRATGRAVVWRAVLAVVAPTAVTAVGAIPGVAMGLLFAMLVVIAAIQHRQPQLRSAAVP